MADHVWFHEHIAAYCADGLPLPERERFDAHRAACSSCALALDEWRGFDQSLQELFADVRPAAGWESRVIEHLRYVPEPRRLRFTPFWRAAASIAAVVMIGLLGFAVHTVAQQGFDFALPGTYAGWSEVAPASVYGPRMAKPVKGASRLHVSSTDLPSDSDPDVLGDFKASVRGGGGEGRRKELQDGESKSVLSTDGVTTYFPTTESGEKRLDSLQKSLEYENGWMYRGKKEEAPLTEGGDLRSYSVPGNVTVQVAPVISNGPAPALPASPPVGSYGIRDGDRDSKKDFDGLLTMPKGPGKDAPLAGRGFMPPGLSAGGGPASQLPPGMGMGHGGGGFAYYRSDPAGKGDPAKTPPPSVEGMPKDDQRAQGKDKDVAKVHAGVIGGKLNKNTVGDVGDLVSLAQKKPDDPEPPKFVAARKIIRTGEIEFEVDAFDATVAHITKLITAIPGAFVATVNSEKLPNGKVRGSVVVRVPPEHLDKFVLDLRGGLAKTAELKSQRIGSQDVTKAYTDIESRLRAARAMEERLINIIKIGKGEIKDLLNVERELGTWRTKIEEMEGEIRYYNNQVSLSTLTITAYEKEIRAAAAIVVTEHVNMRIEADDVEKSLQTALQAVADAKGRVTKSDMKQHAAGQLEAVLSFEVAPKEAGPVRDKLKTLGIVTHHDAQRLQQAEGGTAATGEQIKSRQSDVVFHVTLYNVANIQPRETFVLQTAVQDVPADFKKLQDAVQKAKGQVRVSQLNEQDRMNVNAQLDFDVPSPERAVIDKLLSELGDVFSRNTARAGVGEQATDRKVGYRVTLRSMLSIPPRETYTLQAVSLDVPAGYRKLQDAVAQAKGYVRAGQLSEQDRLNVTATFDFDVPTGERAVIEKLLDEVGDIYQRNTNRVPPNEIATERKVGYRLTLRNVTSVPPRETYTLQAVSLDVPGAYRKLQDAVALAKGYVRAGQLIEQDKLNVTAQFDFDVPKTDSETIDKLLAEVGDVYSRNTVRVPPHETASERKVGYRLTIRNVAGVPAREKVDMRIEVKDVDKAAARIKETVKAAKGTVAGERFIVEAGDRRIALFAFDVPLSEKDMVLESFKNAGKIRLLQPTQNPQAPETKLSLVQINVRLNTEEPIVASEDGMWPQIRASLSYSFKALSYSLMFVILGVCVVLPWAVVLWLAVKAFRRLRPKAAASVGA